MKICGVCEEQAPKYRCPICDLRYCSVGCYKKHKGDCKAQESGSVSSISEVEGITWQNRKDDILGEDEESDWVPFEKLKLLAESEELKSLLCNPHLRQLLLTIDRAEDKENIMKSAMQEPIFVEFADRCLQTVEPPVKEDITDS
ncbi:zinc finger HIT domain-containing protein 3 isoform X1 [Amblyraja radiata]|uniref:zinc finger HIT domain-containing protein 3 isoform X1 n=1 Tax=Amblyraja radiata TaxID=386614 RepID=UPI001404159A|nr:zinc finger HIT domain-containing protein 3 isoform X1 [Amblyraja radiata]